MSTLLLASAWTLLLASASALPEINIAKRDKHNNARTNVLARAVKAHHSATRQTAHTVSTNIFDVLSWSAGGAYYTNITVGTPPQEQTVIVDTGSSDLYFDALSAAACKRPSANAHSCQGGTYDKSKSTSYREIAAAPAFNTSFGDGSTALGPYGSDVVGIGDIRVAPAQFGIAEQVDSATGYAIGLLGLGYSANEAVTNANHYYQNLPEVLRQSGVINSRLYSLYLNDARAYTGTVLFGGIDRSKYSGTLATVNLIPAAYNNKIYNKIDQFITTITAASASVNGRTEELWSGGSAGIEAYNDGDPALPVLLDSGSTAFSVSDQVYSALLSQFTYVRSDGTVPCSYASSGDSLSLQFGGKVTVKVDARSFIVPFINSTTKQQEKLGNGDDACVFLIAPSSVDGLQYGIAGDAILRSMYMVFDLDNGQVSIAQAKVNSTASADIVTVAAGPTGVAAAVSGVNTAASNTFSIAPGVTTAAVSYVASTVSAIGQATGAGAVPTAARESCTSKCAAAGLVMPKSDWTATYVVGVWAACVAMGFGFMM